MGDTLDYSSEDEVDRAVAIYQTPAVRDRRQRVRDLLNPDPSDTVLSIGCGPGFEPAELAETVGPTGAVHGVDRSQPMLAAASDRCADQPQVTLSVGDAARLPVGTETVDAATAIQVYEYVPDVQAALNELARVLKPGGRAVICDTDFDSLVWRSSNRERMQRVLETFTNHCQWPHLGSELAPLVRDAGLTVDRIEPYAILNTQLTADSFSNQLMNAHAAYLVDRETLAPDEIEAWVADLKALDAADETFFNLTQYLYVIQKD